MKILNLRMTLPDKRKTKKKKKKKKKLPNFFFFLCIKFLPSRKFLNLSQYEKLLF